MPRTTFPIPFLKTILLFPFIHLFFIIPSAMPITFNYSNFSSNPGNKIVTKGDATLSPAGFIELTTNRPDGSLKNSLGRAMYSDPLLLWNSTSGKMADFVTHFSFLLTILNKTESWGAYGFAFFLVANNSDIPQNSEGGCLGLFTNCLDLSSSQDQTIAVEFDTFPNEYNPINRHGHVGINIASVHSITYWNTTLNNGSKGNAWITYDSSSYNLRVFLTFADENPLIPLENPILSYDVDLRSVLPEWVTVGFSATTGEFTQLHQIYSWDFNSTDFPSVDSTKDIILSNKMTVSPPSYPPIESPPSYPIDSPPIYPPIESPPSYPTQTPTTYPPIPPTYPPIESPPSYPIESPPIYPPIESPPSYPIQTPTTYPPIPPTYPPIESPPSYPRTEIPPSPQPTGISGPQPEGKNNNIKVVIGSIVGGAGICGLALIVYLLWWRKKARGKQEENEESEEEDTTTDLSMDDKFEKGTGPRRFSYSELVTATNNFAKEGKLGQGGFGGVYKGVLTLRDENLDVAVKRISQGSKQGKKEYISEVTIISRLRHRNLVKLIGWCHERGQFLLVYEFMPNGSLDFHLFQGRSVLTWAMRHRIALGLASALLYLHEEWEECVIHRDIKCSNVMLDSSFNAKLGDFGLARLVDPELGSQTTVLAGTMGYLAPECMTSFKASKEGDVYSFGVVTLEIACGRRVVEPKEEPGKVGLVAWVWDLYASGKLIEAVDQNLSMDFEEQQMERLLVVGLWCAHLNHKLRPSIRQALSVLQFETPMPNLPSEMSMPSYINQSLLSSTRSHEPSNATNSQLMIGNSSTTSSSQLTASSNVLDSASLLHSAPR